MDDDEISGMKFRPVITLGTILVLIGMGGSMAALLWQGGAIRATLEASIRTEHDLREVEMRAIRGDLDVIRGDIRDVRTIVLNNRPPPAKTP